MRTCRFCLKGVPLIKGRHEVDRLSYPCRPHSIAPLGVELEQTGAMHTALYTGAFTYITMTLLIRVSLREQAQATVEWEDPELGKGWGRALRDSATEALCDALDRAGVPHALRRAMWLQSETRREEQGGS